MVLILANTFTGALLASLPGGVDKVSGLEGFSSLVSFSFLSSQALHFRRSFFSLEGEFLLLSSSGGGFTGFKAAVGWEGPFDDKVQISSPF